MNKPLHIGLLLCHSFEDILDTVGGLDYSAIFRQQLLSVDPNITFSDFSVHEGEFPKSVDQCDVWLVNGSPEGVYDDIPWIHTLSDFIKQLDTAKKPTVGICFGHQLMAQVLGGKVELSGKGWGIGLSHNTIVADTAYMQPKTSKIDVMVFHQDQVVQLPSGSKVLAKSDFCPNYMVEYNPHMLGIQGHPEFTAKMIEGILSYETYAKHPTLRAQGMANLEGHPDMQLLFGWMVNFYRQAAHPAKSL